MERIADGFARMPEAECARRCRECPKRDRCGVCAVRGQHVPPDAVCCRYGLALMDAERKRGG